MVEASNSQRVEPKQERCRRSSGRPTHRQPLDTQRRLAHAHGYALAFLAAGAYAAVKAHVVADHGDLLERLGAAADDGRAFHGVLDLAVFHPVGFAGREHELARGNVHLSAAEAYWVEN